MLPCSDGTKMNLLLVKLGPSTGESGIWLAFPEALAIAMVEGDITYGGPTVLNEYGGMESWHVFRVLLLLCENTENSQDSPTLKE